MRKRGETSARRRLGVKIKIKKKETTKKENDNVFVLSTDGARI